MYVQMPTILWWLLALSFPYISVSAAATPPASADSLRPRPDENGITKQISIPASWAIASNGMDIFQATNACVMLTSPVVGGVYPTSASLQLSWLYNKTAINVFLENVGSDEVKVNLTLSLLWFDNYTNKTGVIANNLDPASGLYLWDASADIPDAFNKRLYIIVQSHWEGLSEEQQTAFSLNATGFELDHGLTCRNHDQIAGPFTLLSQPGHFFFVTGPDPGVMKNNSILGNLGHGTGFLSKVPMGRFFAGIPIPITWYCTITNIKAVSLYLVPTNPEHKASNLTLAERIDALSARFYYRAPLDPTSISPTRQYRLLLHGYAAANDSNPSIVSWAADGPYTIQDISTYII
ncbi:hypothetical protein EC973_006684 [Apophysomyces ossiformis]|uniref:Uncharacterized protein n=1 Tax=Apophysomyces ossiformis TaxID=679940 RepID=A0A8H7BN48_9FUNG|nr:hypothetical protein EC973_006684 [Apophysomyces ossiformis]